MDKPLVDRVAAAIVREARKWDGVANYGDMLAAVSCFARPLARRLVRMVKGGKR